MSTLETIPTGQLVEPSQFEIERRDLRAEYAQVLAAASIHEVTDDESNAVAVQYGRLLQTATKALDEFYKPIKKQFDDAKKKILDQEKLDVAEVKTSKDRMGTMTLNYTEAQEKQRLKEQAEARAAAIARQEEERLEEAIALAAQGLTHEADLRLEETLLPPAVIVPTGQSKPSGSVRRENWKAVVTNKSALVTAVAAGKVPMQAVEPSQSWLDKMAVQFREGLNYPGVSVTKEVTQHFRS